jgi:site-specific DNA-methyltransferase (adenine-specific)
MLGDCLERLRELPDCSVDSVVTDPPYGLSFMGKKWDYDVPSVEVWTECLRVLKPGGHLLAFAGTRTQHRMAVRIEDAGFEIRDMIAWVYGSGFPKSLDVSKAIDKAAGAEREFIGKVAGMGKQNPEWNGTAQGRTENSFRPEYNATSPATEAARQWQGWGTALKPALEPITVARKPLGEKTVAANVLEHGTGGINVDGCRVGTEKMGGYVCSQSDKQMFSPSYQRAQGYRPEWDRENKPFIAKEAQGRWPANLIHDGSNEVDSLLNSAARFFYCAKASKKDRDEGCEGLAERGNNRYGEWQGTTNHAPKTKDHNKSRNHHPTVKPTDLMRYLCRLVTKPGGVVLDPFMGSGSTGKAAVLEGFQFIGIEREEEYLEIATRRIADVSQPSGLRNILDSSPRNDTSVHEQSS